MEYFTEKAYTPSECIQKIRDKYGDSYDILTQKSIRIGGVFGFFSREGVEMTGVITSAARRNAAPVARKPISPEEEMKQMEAEKNKIIAQAQAQNARLSDPIIQALLTNVNAIKERLDTAFTATSAVPEHPTLAKIQSILFQNDFTAAYCKAIVDRAKKEFSLEQLENYDGVQDTVLEWIGESIQIYQEDEFHKSPQIVVIIGPTGVGKTTTIAKLAAMYAFARKDPLAVRMISIDNYRIGAEHQIEAYGSIMEIPVSSVKTYEELKEALDYYSEQADLILIDTIGKSPRASVELGEMKQLLEACGGKAEYHLALMANTKASDITEILQQFEFFGYRSVIITKMDETKRFGNVISALAERGKSISFFTTGQQVPKDIQRAYVVRFLINLEGFRINRKKIEALFPNGESENS